MIDAVLDWAGVTGATAVLDVGCGVGGSARHIARRYGASATGVTLSPVQAQRAAGLTASAGLEGRVSVVVADALALPFPPGSFDLLWSLESGEHMPDKALFLAQMARVARPGARLVVATWCCRPGALSEAEQRLLARICDAYHLPAWVPLDAYVGHAEALGLRDVRTADWTEDVAPFWQAVIATALTPRGVWGLLTSGLGTLRGALVMPLMQLGMRTGLIRFVLLSATV